MALADPGADAIKTGMLGDAAAIEAVAEALAGTGLPLVIDPVMVAKGGAVLLETAALSALKRDLLPLATLLTPNLPEAELLTGLAIPDLDAMHRAAEALLTLGVPAVLLKGGTCRGRHRHRPARHARRHADVHPPAPATAAHPRHRLHPGHRDRLRPGRRHGAARRGGARPHLRAGRDRRRAGHRRRARAAGPPRPGLMFLDRHAPQARRRRRGLSLDGAADRQPADLRLTTAVTFLVGENGCGKSTLLEGMAWGRTRRCRQPPSGSRPDARQRAAVPPGVHASAAPASAYTRLFLRAEDVFGFTNRVAADMAGLRAEAPNSAARQPGVGRDLAMGVALGEAGRLARTYGATRTPARTARRSCTCCRRGCSRDGLYFLDEPETPLSPSRVLALMMLIEEFVAKGSQFVIATHSPILLALPGATILQAENGALSPPSGTTSSMCASPAPSSTTRHPCCAGCGTERSRHRYTR